MSNNEYACILSHLAAFKLAKKEGLDYVAIFEDDILFLPTFSKDLQYYLSVCPPFCLMLLGAQHAYPPTIYDANFLQLHKSWGAFAYIVNCEYIDEIISAFESATKITDAILIDLQKKYLCIKPKNKLVEHPKGFSTIKEKEVNYSNLT